MPWVLRVLLREAQSVWDAAGPPVGLWALPLDSGINLLACTCRVCCGSHIAVLPHPGHSQEATFGLRVHLWAVHL